MSEQEHHNEQSVLTVTPTEQYPSGELLLSIIQREYDYELERKRTFETRAGILIPFSAAMLTFLLSQVKFKELKAVEVTNIGDVLFYGAYALFAIISVVCLVSSIIFFMLVLVSYKYDRLEINRLETYAIHPVNVMSFALLEKYKDIIQHNHEINNAKSRYYSRGIYPLILSILTTIFVYGIALNI